MTTNVTVPASVVTRILHLPITSDAEAFATVALASDRVLVQLDAPGAEQRNALGRFIVGNIEAQLERLGAAPRGWRDVEALDAILSDQLYRARLLGSAGIALRFGSLSALADTNGHLGPNDSATLRELVRIADREPLQVYLPRQCAELHIAGHPQPLAAWLPLSSEPGRVASIEYDAPGAPAVTDDSESDEAAVLLPPAVEAFLDARSASPTAENALESQDADVETVPPSRAGSLAANEDDDDDEADANADAAWTADDWASGEWASDEAPEDDVRESAPLESAEPSGAQTAASGAVPFTVALADASPCNTSRDEAREGQTSHSDASEGEALGVDTASPEAFEAETPAGPELPVQSVSPAPSATYDADPARIQRCTSWAAQLQTMNGPKVHGSVEKAFVTAYLPLCRELASGAGPVEARAAAQRWAEGFAQSYASAFRLLGSRTHRPRMVRDVIDIGIRWLGQHQARQCQLLLVSALRFDLGQRLNEELERRLTGAAGCVDQCVLWTALPSNAEAQQLSGEPSMVRRLRSEPEPLANSLGGIEPLQVGNRQLFKLNHIPQELSKPGETEPERLDRLATELADIITPWIRHQPPDTLVVVFGDHGFHWESTSHGTSAAQRGGALPEQVLVPATAWLLQPLRSRTRVAPGLH